MHYLSRKQTKSIWRRDMTIITLSQAGNYARIVTSCKGSWKYQDAYRIATYLPFPSADGKRLLMKSQGTGSKFALTKKTAHKWTRYDTGSLHNAEVIATITDDFGDQCLVIK
jgi:hypothetical protein